MKTLLSGNYAVAQFENTCENGFRNMRLHIYRKNEQEWVYESFIALRVHTMAPVQIAAFTLLGKKAIITTESNSGTEIFEYQQLSGGQWRIVHSSHQFKPGYGGQYQRFQKWSKQSIQKMRSYMRVPVPTFAGV
jgi:hypothetical protein